MRLTTAQLLARGVNEVIDEKNLTKKLRSGKRLRIKYGIDPTGSDLHLGHVVLLRKLRQFQDAGHHIILLIGDATALIGDPTGRDTTRPPLTPLEIKKNSKKYLDQAGKIIDTKKIELRHNSEWFNQRSYNLVLDLMRHATIEQMMHRADFKERQKKNHPITLLEATYPLWQGYDSVALKADLELGGTDQKFNLLMGRTIQKHYGQEEQNIFTMRLIEGTDGVKKMSKSYGNHISVDASPEDMFGKIMSIPDELMEKYFETLTDEDMKKIKKMIAQDPRKAKAHLAHKIVSLLHSDNEARRAEEVFNKKFTEKIVEDATPLNIGGKKITGIELLLRAGVASKGEARRLIQQGGVTINHILMKDGLEKIEIIKGSILKIGKKRFFRLS